MATATLTAAQQALVDALEVRIDEVSEGSDRPSFAHGALYDHLVDSTYDVLRDARGSRVYEVATDGTPGYAVGLDRDATNTGLVIPLPIGFVRVLRLRLKGWRRPVDTFADMDSPGYKAQQNSRTGATAGRPLAVVVPTPFNAPRGFASVSIEAFPLLAQDAGISELTVVVNRAPELFPSSLRDALLWTAANRALTAARQSGPAGDAAAQAARALSAPVHGAASM